MNYLQEAINRVEASQGEVTKNYEEWAIREAQLYLQVSIAQSLASIAEDLATLKETAEHDFNMTANLKIFGGGK